MSRNRLEEIRQWKDEIDLTGSEISEHNFFTVHIEWLIEQAKRVQELETVIEQDKRQSVLEGLYEQNKRYREHLELIKQKSSCTMAVSHATKALEEEK